MTKIRMVSGPSDINEFCIVAEALPHWCDFKCYDCIGMGEGENGQYDVPIYALDGAIKSGDDTNDLEKAQVFLAGHIKWDGCMDIRFPEQDTCMLHFCGRKDAARVGKLIDRLFDIAKQLLTSWDGDD